MKDRGRFASGNIGLGRPCSENISITRQAFSAFANTPSCAGSVFRPDTCCRHHCGGGRPFAPFAVWAGSSMSQKEHYIGIIRSIAVIFAVVGSRAGYQKFLS